MLSKAMADPVSKILCLRLSCVFYMLVIILLYSQTSTLAIGDDKENLAWSVCSNEPTKYLSHPYNALTGFTCTPLWRDFILSFNQDVNNISTLVLMGNYSARWIGIGFSKDGKMKGSSAMVGWIGEDGKSSIKQYYLEGYEPSQVKADKGGLWLTKVAPVVARQEGFIYMAFQIKFEKQRGFQNIILAVGDGIPRGTTLMKHVDRKSTSIDFTAGTPPSALETPESLKRTHGLLGIIGWGTFIPIGALIPRHFAHSVSLRFYCHAVLNFLGFSIGLACVSNGKSVMDLNEKDPQVLKWIDIHRKIGIGLVLFATIQILTFIVKSEKEAESKSYKIWFLFHRWVGVLLIMAAYFNIVFGIQIGKASKLVRVAFAVSLATFVVTFIVLEVMSFIRGPQKIHDVPPPVFKPDPNDASPVFKVDPRDAPSQSTLRNGGYY